MHSRREKIINVTEMKIGHAKFKKTNHVSTKMEYVKFILSVTKYIG